MIRLKTTAISLRALAALAAFAVLGGCESSSPTRAAVEVPPAPIPHIVHQSNGEELLQLDPARLPGATLGEVRKVELPAELEANGQVTFDDRRVSSIVSRVAGRIEQVRVSQWDNVRRGEPIVALYSPDFMTAEAEYLQAQADYASERRSRHFQHGGNGGLDGGRGRAQAGTARDGAGRHHARSAFPIRSSGCARQSAARWSKTRPRVARRSIRATCFIRSARSTMSGSPPISMRTTSRACTWARSSRR